MLHTDRAIFTALYGATPKAMAFAPQPGATVPEPHDGRLRWLAVQPAPDGTAVVHDPSDPPSDRTGTLPLEIPPANVWALWLPAPDETGMVDALLAWWARAGGEASLPAVIRGDRAALDRALLDAALARAEGLEHDNALLHRDLATLRQSLEEEVRIPPEVEELIDNLRLSPPRLIAKSPPPESDIAVPHADGPGAPPAGAATLVQRLPVSARGLAGIDLFVTHPGSATLRIALTSADAGLTLARWVLPAETLKAGWLPLRLEQVSSRSLRALDLTVSCDGGEPARLSICPTGLLREYRLSGSGQPGSAASPARMLAFRIWGGYPGQHAAESMSGSQAASVNPVIAIADDVLAGVRLTREITAGFPCFGYTEPGEILLRPLRTTPSAAAFALPATSGLTAVSCEAVIDDARCQTRGLGVRLVAMPHGSDVDAAERGEGALGDSDWEELDVPLKGRRLTARLAEPADAPVDVHLLTRLPKGGSIRYARIVFRRFETEIHTGTAWATAPALPVDAGAHGAAPSAGGTPPLAMAGAGVPAGR